MSRPSPPPAGPTRVVLDDDGDLRRGLGQLVVVVVDLLRELLARQAVRRLRAGSLTEVQQERLGDALRQLDGVVSELRDLFGVGESDAQPPPVGLPTGGPHRGRTS